MIRIQDWVLIFGAALILTLTACSNKIIPVAYKCPSLRLPADPDPLSLPTTKSTAADVVKFWVTDDNAYRAWNKAVRQQVNRSTQK